MKNKRALFGFAVLVTAIVFGVAALSLAGCSNGTTATGHAPDPAYFGTWRMGNPPTYRDVTISANLFHWVYWFNGSENSSYTITGLSWTPVDGLAPNYPTGYILKGKVTAIHGYEAPAGPDGWGTTVGHTAVVYWSIHTGKNSLVWGTVGAPQGSSGDVYTKQ